MANAKAPFDTRPWIEIAFSLRFVIPRHWWPHWFRAKSGVRRFFFFFFFHFKNGYTTLVHNNPRLHGAAAMNLNYYAQKKFSRLLTREFIACYKLRMILSTLYSRRCSVALLAFPVFLAFLFVKISWNKTAGIPNFYESIDDKRN